MHPRCRPLENTPSHPNSSTGVISMTCGTHSLHQPPTWRDIVQLHSKWCTNADFLRLQQGGHGHLVWTLQDLTSLSSLGLRPPKPSDPDMNFLSDHLPIPSLALTSLVASSASVKQVNRLGNSLSINSSLKITYGAELIIYMKSQKSQIHYFFHGWGSRTKQFFHIALCQSNI